MVPSHAKHHIHNSAANQKIKLHDLKHNAHKILSSLLLTTPRIWPTPLLLYFFRNPYFWQHPFNDIAPVEYRIKTKINPWEKVVSCLEDYIIILNSFLYKTLFKQHPAEIWFEIITISGITLVSTRVKRITYGRLYTWKTCWIKSILLQNSYIT